MDTCVVCGHTVSKVIMTDMKSVYSLGKKYTILECTNCETYLTYPRPKKSELSLYYRSNYAFVVHHLVNREKKIRARKLIQASKIFHENSRVLEIGTGAGEFASEVVKYVSSFDGCELDKSSVEIANSNPRVNVSCLDVEDYLPTVKKNYYDIAVFSHTLEHFLNPIEILQNVLPHIKEKGKILIVVPNRKASPKIFKNKWGYWQVPIHITHHSRESIIYTCEKVGLNVERIMFRNADFMALGSYLINILNKTESPVTPNSKFLPSLIRIFSSLYALTYRFGSQDMVVIASK